MAIVQDNRHSHSVVCARRRGAQAPRFYNLSPDVHHRSRGGNEAGFANVVTLFFVVQDNIRIKSASSSSLAPACIRAARSCSRTENRQVRILPSEVTRTRLQCPQKGCDTGAMMPISPTPSSKT